jgi:uncharacterized membrane protein (UPF0127 family)
VRSRTVINQRNGIVVAQHTRYADSWLKRLVGLLSESSLEKGHGLWLLPCNSIHTIGMRFPIDVVFLDKDNQIKKLTSTLRPFRLCRSVKGTHSVLELPSGTITTAGLRQGDKLLEQ